MASQANATLSWHDVCGSDEVSEDDPKAVTANGREIGLFRAAGGLFAIDNICSHEFAYLTKGWVEGDVVECPLHEARFCLRSGACLQGPATVDIATFQVREEGGRVFVGLTG